MTFWAVQHIQSYMCSNDAHWLLEFSNKAWSILYRNDKMPSLVAKRFLLFESLGDHLSYHPLPHKLEHTLLVLLIVIRHFWCMDFELPPCWFSASGLLETAMLFLVQLSDTANLFHWDVEIISRKKSCWTNRFVLMSFRYYPASWGRRMIKGLSLKPLQVPRV